MSNRQSRRVSLAFRSLRNSRCVRLLGDLTGDIVARQFHKGMASFVPDGSSSMRSFARSRLPRLACGVAVDGNHCWLNIPPPGAARLRAAFRTRTQQFERLGRWRIASALAERSMSVGSLSKILMARSVSQPG